MSCLFSVFSFLICPSFFVFCMFSSTCFRFSFFFSLLSFIFSLSSFSLFVFSFIASRFSCLFFVLICVLLYFFTFIFTLFRFQSLPFLFYRSSLSCSLFFLFLCPLVPLLRCSLGHFSCSRSARVHAESSAAWQLHVGPQFVLSRPN